MSNLLELITKEESADSPNSVLRNCLGVFDKVIVAGYGEQENGESDIIIYACNGITEEEMALISLKLQKIANMSWVKKEEDIYD